MKGSQLLGMLIRLDHLDSQAYSLRRFRRDVWWWFTSVVYKQEPAEGFK